MTAPECFIVMPFGSKPIPDGSGRLYDFDKVYRVVIQRAVREAGMTPIRADERVTSALIHTDMFRDLRDRAVVLADLSLDNPNVFYELGVRHVMSSSGTVLMCRKNSVLPFDIKLSRVTFYDFDGVSLDWEEVERVVKQLKMALQEAQKGQPDSPVHALLESVLRRAAAAGHGGGAQPTPEDEPDGEPARRYQELVAEHWESNGHTLAELFERERVTVFGSRALAYLCERTDPLSGDAVRLANHLGDAQQYRLANDMYRRLHAAGRLPRKALLAYASSHSEANLDLPGVDHAIMLAEEALASIQHESPALSDSALVLAQAECHRRLAGLRQWRWQLSNDPGDLDRAIASFSDAIQFNEQARLLGVLRYPGFLAQSRLKQILLLRIRDGDLERPDVEGHHDAILALRHQPEDDPKSLSYLGWFQAIALADLGNGAQAHRKALATFAIDSRLMLEPQHVEIGRRQYVQLRRLLEQYAAYLRNPSLIGQISQVLQTEDPPA